MWHKTKLPEYTTSIQQEGYRQRLNVSSISDLKFKSNIALNMQLFFLKMTAVSPPEKIRQLTVNLPISTFCSQKETGQ